MTGRSGPWAHPPRRRTTPRPPYWLAGLILASALFWATVFAVILSGLWFGG